MRDLINKRARPITGRALAFVILLALALWPQRVHAYGSCGQGGGPGGRIVFQGAYYWLVLPAGYDQNREWPLILGLHGDEGSPEASGSMSWATGPFIYVAPKAPTTTGSWYQPDMIAATTKWFDDLLREVFAKYNVDLDKVYAWGLSGGGEFLSYHVPRSLQNVMAAVQFNMGGSYWGWFLGGQPRRTGSCKIPARFAVNDGTSNQCAGYNDMLPPPIDGMGSPATGDFLCPTARALYLQLMMLGHEAEWSDWASTSPCLEPRGHCWDDVQAGPGARDWFLRHTLCGVDRPDGCGEPAFGSDPMVLVLDDPPWVSGVAPPPPGTGGAPAMPQAGAGAPGTGGAPSGTGGAIGGGAPAGPVPAGPGPGTAGGSAPGPIPAGTGGAPQTTIPSLPASRRSGESSGCALTQQANARAVAPPGLLLGVTGIALLLRRRPRA